MRPFYYGAWNERTRAHAWSAEAQTSPEAERGWGSGAEDVDLPTIVARLRTVTAPVRVIGGEHDAITGVCSVELVARSFPNATTKVLADAGHFPWVDTPHAFVRSVVA